MVRHRRSASSTTVGCSIRGSTSTAATASGIPLAYAFVDPVAGAHWIGVEQDGYIEVYEVLGGLPVRVATHERNRPRDDARRRFEVTQYDAEGRELVRGELEAAVAG